MDKNQHVNNVRESRITIFTRQNSPEKFTTTDINMDPTYLFTMNIVVFTRKAFCLYTVYLFIDFNFFYINFRLFWSVNVKNKNILF